jgi:hypothetical protein
MAIERRGMSALNETNWWSLTGTDIVSIVDIAARITELYEIPKVLSQRCHLINSNNFFWGKSLFRLRGFSRWWNHPTSLLRNASSSIDSIDRPQRQRQAETGRLIASQIWAWAGPRKTAKRTIQEGIGGHRVDRHHRLPIAARVGPRGAELRATITAVSIAVEERGVAVVIVVVAAPEAGGTEEGAGRAARSTAGMTASAREALIERTGKGAIGGTARGAGRETGGGRGGRTPDMSRHQLVSV